jgi:hypothetical protein
MIGAVLGEVGLRFEEPGGGVRTPDEQTASSGVRTNGSAMPIALRQGEGEDSLAVTAEPGSTKSAGGGGGEP